MVAKAQATQSSPLIWVALLLTLVAVAWTAMQEEEIDTAVDLVNTKSITISSNVTEAREDGLLTNEKKVAMAETYAWQQINREVNTKEIKNIFNPHSWEVKPKLVKTKPLPPPPPTAPPLPFTYMGKLDQDSDGVQVFLLQGDKVLTVNVGSNVNQLWRLDGESDVDLVFTYLPLDQQKVLRKNASGRPNFNAGQFRPRTRNVPTIPRQAQQLNL